jgi:hypothetical protein
MRKSAIFKYLSVAFFTLTVFSAPSKAQFYNTGDPPNVRWRTFHSNHFQFIFPAELEQQTRAYAVSFDEAWTKVTGQLNHQPKSIPVVIHPYVSRSNGLVVWAPKRMEIYPVPPQTIDPQPWIQQLAIHETRHVAQISKLNQGFTRALSFITGEQSIGLAAGIIPAWFYEGDAVYAETAFSLSGRGRSPSFEMKINAQVSEDEKIFSYDKSQFGSYRDFVPNHYEYGYQMVAYASEKFGHDFWSETLDFTGRYPFIPFAFRRGMRKQQGISPDKLYQLAAENRKTERKIGNDLQDKSSQTVSPAKSEYINYYSPQYLNTNTLVVLKDGPGFVRQIVTLNEHGEEKKLYIPGSLSVNRISANAGKITWSETIPDARWGNQSYSVIRVFDISTKTETQLTRKTRYYAPSLSPSGNYIATIENDVLNNCYLVILDAWNGKIISREQTSEGSFLQFPEWASENELIMTRQDEKGKHIVSFDSSTGAWNTLLSGGQYDLTRPTGNDEIIYFNSTWSGKDEIFALERSSGNIYKLTYSDYGAFEPALIKNENSFVFTDYTNRGFEVRSVKAETKNLSPFVPPVEGPHPYYAGVIEEPVNFRPDEEKSNEFNSKPYSKPGNLFNFHSWAPFSYDFENINPIDNPQIYPGLTLLSQNLINTAVSQLSYAYKNGRHFTSNSFTYSGFLTVMEFGMNYGDDPLIYSGRDTIGPGEIKSDLLNIRTRFSIPLNLTMNRYIRGFTPSLQVNYNNSYYHYTFEDEYKRGRVSLDWQLNYYSYLRLAPKDISPRWGSQLRFRYFSSPFEKENFGSIFTTTAVGYFPGLFRHHSIRVRGNYQKQNPVKYLYQSLIEFPRGFPVMRTEILYTLNADYFLPLLYPDLSIPGLIYLKRIRGAVFYDYALNNFRIYNQSLNQIQWMNQYLFSTGTEIIADYHLFRLLFPFSSGIRINYLPKYGDIKAEFIFSINLGIF